jgi:hypothetical protein
MGQATKSSVGLAPLVTSRRTARHTLAAAEDPLILGWAGDIPQDAEQFARGINVEGAGVGVSPARVDHRLPGTPRMEGPSVGKGHPPRPLDTADGQGSADRQILASPGQPALFDPREPVIHRGDGEPAVHPTEPAQPPVEHPTVQRPLPEQYRGVACVPPIPHNRSVGRSPEVSTTGSSNRSTGAAGRRFRREPGRPSFVRPLGIFTCSPPNNPDVSPRSSATARPPAALGGDCPPASTHLAGPCCSSTKRNHLR